MRTVRARFANGVLEPVDALDLDEGQEIVLSIDDRPPADRASRGMQQVAHAWKGTHHLEKLKRNIYATQHDRHQSRVSRIA